MTQWIKRNMPLVLAIALLFVLVALLFSALPVKAALTPG